MTWVEDNLTPSERTAYKTQLVAGHRSRVLVQFLDINEKNPVTLTNQVLDGDVQVNTTADISRTCTITLADPSGKVQWGHRDGSDYAIYPGRLLRVHHGTFVTSLSRWVDVPVFTGPVTAFTRDRDTVKLDAAGKEWLMHAPFVQWHTMKWHKGVRVLGVMDRVLDARGETHRVFPKRTPHRLKRPIALPRPNDTWPFLKFLANMMDKQLFYRGDGALVLQTRKTSGFAWTYGDSDILSLPTYTYEVGEMFNTVNIAYQHGKRQARHTHFINRQHPISPETLGRNNTPLVMAVFYDSDTINSRVEANTMAKKLTDNQGTVVPVTLSFSSLPIPFIEEDQRVAAKVDGSTFSFRMREFSFGLAPGGQMSVNITRDQLKKQGPWNA